MFSAASNRHQSAARGFPITDGAYEVFQAPELANIGGRIHQSSNTERHHAGDVPQQISRRAVRVIQRPQGRL